MNNGNCRFTADTFNTASDDQVCNCISEARKCANKLGCDPLVATMDCSYYYVAAVFMRPSLTCTANCNSSIVSVNPTFMIIILLSLIAIVMRI
jgi:hypothetical protein